VAARWPIVIPREHRRSGGHDSEYRRGVRCRESRAGADESLPGIATTGPGSYDITGDGSAFLAVSPASDEQPTAVEFQEIHIVINWFEELKRLAPGK
jgi:hypothetical protein